MKNHQAATLLVVILLLAGIGIALSGCATKPEAQIKTVTVEKAVPVPCKPDLGPRPALMGKDAIKAALAAAPTLDDQVKIVTAQLLLYLGWVPVLEGAITGCSTVPKD